MDLDRISIRYVLYLFLIFAFNSHSVIHCCDADEINACNEAFKDSLPEGTSNTGVSKDLDKEHLDTVCTAFYVFKSCVDPHLGDCSGELNNEIKGEEQLYDYICTAGLEDHIGYDQCLSEDDTKTDLQNCQIVLSVKYQLATATATEAQFCEWIDDFIDCHYNAAETHCGEGAASHQRKITKLYNEPAFQERCTSINWDDIYTTTSPPIIRKEKSSENHAALIAGIVVPFLVVMIIIALGAYCLIHRKRMADQDSGPDMEYQASSQTVNMPPGAYASQPPPYTQSGGPFEGAMMTPPAYDTEDPNKKTASLGQDFSAIPPKDNGTAGSVYDNKSYVS